jgi:Ni2+-binding GTPase involved in maturation of urease and hydrogenase/dsDNA-binding SOS-regulon protein
MTQLHLVGGFLGSGKTTAIAAAAKQLLTQGQRVGVVTNDQGKYLVDTAFFALQDVPAVEVSGGCFCCGYDDFAARLQELRESARPNVIFAESVGSCADIVATVVKPLLELRNTDLPPSSLSVFADARLLLRRLQGEPLPFSDDVVYVFDQQLAEAGLLVVNKVDLLQSAQLAMLKDLLAARYPDKRVLLQNSLDADSIAVWLAEIERGELALAGRPLDIDYARYGEGEIRLAWLDQVLDVSVAAGPVRPGVVAAISAIVAAIRAHTDALAHVKFVVSAQDGEAKISFTSMDDGADWQATLPPLAGRLARLLVNARVELPAEALAEIVARALANVPAHIVVVNSAAFHPALPHPPVRLP